LQRSHLVGRAIYKLIRDDGDDDPIVMTPDVVLKTSRQVRDYVLCTGCEDLFSKNGEQYATGLVWRRHEGFPLLDKLRLALPTEREANYSVFSGVQVGIDTDKLAYYALSLVWRSAIRQWQTIGNQTTSVVLPAEEEESIRKYLLGETLFPGNIGVAVTVCKDLASQVLVLPPSRSGDFQNFLIYPSLVRGIEFTVLIATAPGVHFAEVCCLRSPAKRLFVLDRTMIRLNEVRHFYEESKLARNVNS
jgi:hypothetical protein